MGHNTKSVLGVLLVVLLLASIFVAKVLLTIEVNNAGHQRNVDNNGLIMDDSPEHLMWFIQVSFPLHRM